MVPSAHIRVCESYCVFRVSLVSLLQPLYQMQTKHKSLKKRVCHRGVGSIATEASLEITK